MGTQLPPSDLGYLGCWSWDARSDSVHADATLERLFGICPHPEGAGWPMARFHARVHPDDLEWLLETRPLCFGPSGHGVVEYRIIDETGAIRWMMCRSIYETDENNVLIRAHGMMFDVTAFKADGTSTRMAPTAAGSEGTMIDATIVAYTAARFLGDTHAMDHLEAVLLASAQRIAHDLLAEQARVTH